MPIYEYQCEKCGYIFEQVILKADAVKISTYCPACAAKKKFNIAKRIMSSCSFQIHGFNENNGYSKNGKT